MGLCRNLFWLLVNCTVGLFLCSCGGGSASPPPPNPVPAIQSISPTTTAAGTGGFTLTISGSNFLSSSAVSWNGAAKPAAFVSSSQLTVAVSATDLSTSGTVQVAVSNPAPGGGQGSTNFTVSPPAAPILSSVSPNTLGAGTAGITLTVAGNNFVANSVVEWNGSTRPTTYVSNTQLTAAIPASDLTNSIASLSVTVMTPSPGGGGSNSLPVAIVNPGLPTITSLSPTQVVLGSGAFTLTVNGTNFVGGATVDWNSISRVTHFVSTTQLTASILASDIALMSPASASITVQNPAPSAGISNPVSLTLENPAPQVTSVSPNTAVAGPPLTVTITGTGFISGATAQLGSQVFPATYNGSTSLSVQISAPVGPTNLTVTNPSPSAGPSNAVTFTGTAAGPGVQLILPKDPSGNVVPANAISSTGRYIGYFDINLNGSVLDTCLGGPSGCTPSLSSFPLPGGTVFPSSVLGISTDGRYVDFSGVGPGMTPPALYLADSCLGASSGCGPSVNNPAIAIWGAFMTPNARYISYGVAMPTNAPQHPPFPADIYDTCIGAAAGCTPSSVATVTSTANSVPASSADGRYSIYENSSSQIVLHDSCLGAPAGCAISETVVSNNSMTCQSATISSDASYIAWMCTTFQVYLQPTCLNSSSGCSATPSQIALSSQSNQPIFVSTGGRFTVFQMFNAPNGQDEVYVYDSCKGAPAGCAPQTIPISENASGALANSGTTLMGMSIDGKYVLFSSQATNLLPAAPAGNVSYIALNPLF